MKNLEWATQNCSVSFETIGIWPENFDGTDINSVCKDGEEQFLVCADDFGKIRLFSFPASQPKVRDGSNLLEGEEFVLKKCLLFAMAFPVAIA